MINVNKINVDPDDELIEVDYLIGNLTTHIYKLTQDLTHLQRASTNVILTKSCASALISQLNTLFVLINKCKEV